MDTQSISYKKAGIKDEYKKQNIMVNQRPPPVYAAFLRKVYGILYLQLALAAWFTTLGLHVPLFYIIFNDYDKIHTVCLLVYVTLLMVMVYKRKKYPSNLLLVLLFTLTQALTAPAVVSYYDLNTVHRVLINIAVGTLSLFVYSCQSKWSLNTIKQGLFACSVVFAFSLFYKIYFAVSFGKCILSIVMSTTYIWFVILELYVNTHELLPEEYITASIDLYLDIIYFFIGFVHKLGQLVRILFTKK